MSAADDALRWAHDTYATYNLTDGEAAATGAALAQAEQLARIAGALEGIRDDLSPAKVGPQLSGASAIAAERARQISAEGYTPEHDAAHDWWWLAQAGACYADHAASTASGTVDSAGVAEVHPFWPWHDGSWKPTPGDPRRQLVKAGALIAAAIDALDAQTGEPR